MAVGPFCEGAETMGRGLRRSASLGIALCLSGLLAGCVERRYVVIMPDQPGAIVYENGQPIGAAPADHSFVYPGTYHFTIVRDGYQTLQIDQCIAPRWYEYPGIDFITENLIPWTFHDVREFKYYMQP